MKSTYNVEDDILRVLWTEEPIDESDEIEPGVILDYDKDGNVVGLEILKASQRVHGFPKTALATVA